MRRRLLWGTAALLILALMLTACASREPAPEDLTAGLESIQEPEGAIPLAAPESEQTPDTEEETDGKAHGELLVHYYGKLLGVGWPQQTDLHYDVRMYEGTQPDAYNRAWYLEITFSNANDGRFQSFVLDDVCVELNSVTWALQVMDINQDGYDDLLLDMGLSGKMTTALCYVYDSESGEMVQADFELMSPSISFQPTGEPVVIAWDEVGGFPTEDGYDWGCSKYRVEGSHLVLLSTLRWNYRSAQNWYTVTDYTGEEPVVVADQVSYEEFLQLDWYGIPLIRG